MKKLLLILGLVLMASQAWSATYYIDPTCGTSGNGTTTVCGANGPFKTWAEITSRNLWAAGNTYSQKSGTTAYETITVGASGTAGNVITINSYGTGMANLNGGVVISPSEWSGPDANGFYRTPLIGYPPYSTVLRSEDGIYLKYYMNGSGNSYNDGTYSYYKPTSGSPSNHFVRKHRYYGIYLGNNDYITITGFNISFFRYGIAGIIASGTEANNHIRVVGNVFSDMMFGFWSDFYNAVSTGITITNNTFDYIRMAIEFQSHSDCHGGTGNFDSVTIAYNSITNGNKVRGTGNVYNWEGVDPSNWDEEGIGFQALTNSYVHHNHISGDIRGIVLFVCAGLDAYNNRFYNNYIQTDRNPIQFEPAIDARSFYQNRAYYNVLDGGSKDGFAGAFRASNVTLPVSQYNYIYNNVLANGTNGINGSVTMDYYVIKNNIYYKNTNSQMYINNANTHFEIDYNIYEGTRANFWGKVNYPPAVSWSDWKTVREFDTHSYTNTDPLFISATDYRLQSTSPARDAGLNVGFTRDFLDNYVPIGSAPDIGAYEYGSYPASATTTTPPTTVTGTTTTTTTVAGTTTTTTTVAGDTRIKKRKKIFNR